jgi:tRNA modification GTPase
MNFKRRTIAALATAPGLSGMAVIRVSGDLTFEIMDKCFVGKKKISEFDSHSIHYGLFKNDEKVIDTVTVSVFKSPTSYTGEDVIEIACHGGNLISSEILSVLYNLGAYLPEPGEFTRRAFLNGKLDLAQVEAVSDIIHANSRGGALSSVRQLNGKFTSRLKELRENLLEAAGLLELELDFSDEDLEFVDKNNVKNKILESKLFCQELIDSYQGSNILRNGFHVAIVGRPNAGKSTLFNALAGRDRAIVSEKEGTTRDYLEEFIVMDSISVKLLDTAGLRDTEDEIELQGIKLVKTVLEQADLIILLNDISENSDKNSILFKELNKEYSNLIQVNNKCDLSDLSGSTDSNQIDISAKTGQGVDLLKQEIVKIAKSSTDRVGDALINIRHKTLLESAVNSMDLAVKSIDELFENEIISIDLMIAVKTIGEITGESYSEEVINKIFSGFCIGK